MTTNTPTSSTQALSPATPEPVLLPASYAQELLWLMHQSAPESVAYNVPRTRIVVGPLDVAALRAAFDRLVERHEILRTTYAFHEEHAVQAVHPPRPADFAFVDLSALPADARMDEARRQVAARAGRPFDLSREPQLRVALFQLDDHEHVLHIDSHHIAFDGWSREIFFRDLAALYREAANGDKAGLPELPIQYADYAIWEREQLAGAKLERLLGWWRDQLADASFVLELPTDFPRPAVPGTGGVTDRVTIEPELLARIKALGVAHDASLYMVLLAAYAAVLHRYTGQADVLVGSPSAGRSRAETEGLIGYFANTLVQRARFASDPTFGELLDQVREHALGAYDHQDIPFEKLVLELQGGQQLSHSPLFQVVFTQLGNADEGAPATLGSAELRGFGGGDLTTKFDLTLFMAERDGALTLMLRARSDLYAPASVPRILGHLRTLLESAVATPDERVSRLAMLRAEERDQLAGWNESDVVLGEDVTIAELFAAQAARVPDRVAVVAGDGSLTYAQLEARANRIAHQLRAHGVGPDVPVGVMLERSTDLVAALLGVLKAGGAYVPVPPELPAARATQQLREARVQAVVTTGALQDRVPAGSALLRLDADAATLAGQPAAPLAVTARPEHLAYVLFTSGSTGTPKGVAVTNANVVRYTRAISRVLADTPRERAGDALAALDGWHFAMVSSIGADLGNTSLFPALLAGGTLHLLGRDIVTEPAHFQAYVAEHAIDVLKITPNHLRALTAGLDAPQLRTTLPHRWAVLGGEALGWDFAQRLLDAGACRVLNHYGPTEATVGASTFEVTPESGAAARAAGAQTVPIGHPPANARLHVLDAQQQPVPVGVPGELYIAGAGVARGYLGRDDLTADRFVSLSFDQRAYRTGDRVRRLPNGAVEFLGRTDDQVKIRGYRVELGEIEQVLRQHPDVAQALVLARSGAAGDEVVAYVVARAQGSGYASSHSSRATPDDVKEWAGSRLPDYMVPTSVLMLERMPLGANGKIDRAALPVPDDVIDVAPRSIAPRSATEEAIATIWKDVLKKDAVSVTDDFIALGGHSLLAIRVLGRLSRTFGVRLPLRTLFDAPTIAQLAEIVDVELQLAAVAALTEAE